MRKAKTALPKTIVPDNRPVLVQCGEHFIDPANVAAIKKCKKGLFIVKLKSEPNPEWPIWLIETEVATLLAHFNIKE